MEGYEHALAMPEVAVVYIPLPTVQRKEWVLRAAAAGKVGWIVLVRVGSREE